MDFLSLSLDIVMKLDNRVQQQQQQQQQGFLFDNIFFVLKLFYKRLVHKIFFSS